MVFTESGLHISVTLFQVYAVGWHWREHNMKQIAVLIMALTLFACGTQETRGGSYVQQASANRVANCTFVKTLSVKNSNLFPGWMPSRDRKSAMANMQNKVASVGGTHFVILGGNSSWWTGNSGFAAEVYRC
jgi:hypothetical protein